MPPHALTQIMIHDDEGSDHSSSSRTQDYERKNKRDRLQGCISAIIDYLDHNGIAKSRWVQYDNSRTTAGNPTTQITYSLKNTFGLHSIAELRLAFSHSRFLPAMRRIQDYIECYAESSLASPEEKKAAAYMVLQAWTSLLEYTRFVHQIVYAEYNELLVHPELPNRRDILRKKLQHMNKVAEYTCGSQSGLFRARKWENRFIAQ